MKNSAKLNMDKEYESVRRLLNINYEIKTVHNIVDNMPGLSQQQEFPLERESDGTRNLFFIAYNLLYYFEQGRVMIIDEFEKSLHPHIVQKLIKLVHDPDINTNNAQLIFTTHAANLLDNELFRRDQIWFTEKDENGVTDLFSLSDIDGVRKNIPLDKWYLSGRFGATPVIDDPDIEF